jgi:23S rRNA (adenine2030-N6)-methyltransferase
VNYHHAFHAGSFADVFKHAVLCRIVHYLCGKEAAFCAIDTHAGEGLYNLTSAEASRGGEWHNGIEKLLVASFPKKCATVLKPYLDVIATFNKSGGLRFYPGSPALIRAYLRPQDRFVACELHSAAMASLVRYFQGDKLTKVAAVDGWKALAGYVPPQERRGLVFIDPPFEQTSDFLRLADALSIAYRKWATGIYVLWYPIKDRTRPDELARRLRRLGIAKILRAELIVSPLSDHRQLNGSGLIVVNPPWPLENELTIILPFLAEVLGNIKPGFTLDWLTGEVLVS